MKSDNGYTLVYSSEKGRIKQEKSPAGGGQRPAAIDGIVRLRREVKGRGGGTVITVSGLPLDTIALKKLGGELKKRCGCGGTVKDGIIEIQGDHREILQRELESRGYKVKLAGG